MAAGQPGRNIVLTTIVEIVGVFLLAILAGASDDVGSIMVIIMVGFLIGWLLINADWFSSLIGKI